MGQVADVVVVGGRVAGCLTALRFAAFGARVVVLEAATFPSDTMSTHFFRGDGLVRSLSEVGVLDEVLATGAPRFEAELMYDNGAKPALVPPQEPGDAGFGLSVRRISLDAILAAAAAAAPGVELRTGTRVEGLVLDGDRVVGVVTGDGEVRGDLVVGADGRRSLVARQVGAQPTQHHAPTRTMSYRIVTGWRAPEGGSPCRPEFSLLGDEIAYALPSDAGTACLAVSMPAADWVASARAREAQLDERLAGHPGLAARLPDTAPVGPVIAARPDASEVLEAAGEGWALVGDAGTHQDPWSGLGMDTAARQSVVLAEAFAAGAGWQQRYRTARDEVTLDRFAGTVAAARDLRSLSVRS